MQRIRRHLPPVDPRVVVWKGDRRFQAALRCVTLALAVVLHVDGAMRDSAADLDVLIDDRVKRVRFVKTSSLRDLDLRIAEFGHVRRGTRPIRAFLFFFFAKALKRKMHAILSDNGLAKPEKHHPTITTQINS
jgi:hypothetical protein